MIAFSFLFIESYPFTSMGGDRNLRLQKVGGVEKYYSGRLLIFPHLSSTNIQGIISLWFIAGFIIQLSVDLVI